MLKKVTFILYHLIVSSVCVWWQVVEQSDSEQHQADALRLLLTLLHRESRHARDFRRMSGYVMLAKVLHSSRCVLGLHMLKVSQLR